MERVPIHRSISAPDQGPASVVSRLDRDASLERTPCGAGSMVWRIWGAGPPLLLLHGASGSWTHWLRNIEPLAACFRVLVPDMPGFGESDMPAAPDDADALAEAITAGLDVMVPPPADLQIAGFSFGGIVGGLTAARLGSRVRTLVLLGAGGLGVTPMSARRPLLPLRPDMTPAEIANVHRENLKLLMIGNPDRADELAVYLQMENLRRARFKSGTIPGSDVLLRALPAIAARIASIVGDRDAFWAPRLADYRGVLMSARPDIDFRLFAGAGHWTIYEAADQATAALLEILRRTDRPTSGG